VYGLVVVVVLNALPEVLYRHRTDSLAAIQEAFDFTIKNWVEWFLPLALVLAPLLSYSLINALAILSGGFVLLPIQIAIISISTLLDEFALVGIALAIIAGTWFMVFRGFLFNELALSSRRKRAFMNRK
jgi:hypothetical protein